MNGADELLQSLVETRAGDQVLISVDDDHAPVLDGPELGEGTPL